MTNFVNNENLNKTLAETQTQQKTYWRKTLLSTSPENDKNKEIEDSLNLTFHHLKKHDMIDLKEKAKIGVSNISALKPQYALLTPHLNTYPT